MLVDSIRSQSFFVVKIFDATKKSQKVYFMRL